MVKGFRQYNLTPAAQAVLKLLIQNKEIVLIAPSTVYSQQDIYTGIEQLLDLQLVIYKRKAIVLTKKGKQYARPA